MSVWRSPRCTRTGSSSRCSAGIRGAGQCVRRHVVAFALCALQGIRDVDAVEGPRFVTPPPDGEAAVVVLHPGQPLDVAGHARLDLGVGGQALGFEGGQHVAQRDDRQDPRGNLLGALERVALQVEHGVGERLQRGGRGGDLQAAELGEDARRGDDRLGDGPLVDRAVGRKGLGGGRRLDRQLDLRGVGPRTGGRRDLEAGRACLRRGRREAHLDAVVGGHGHPPARAIGQT